MKNRGPYTPPPSPSYVSWIFAHSALHPGPSGLVADFAFCASTRSEPQVRSSMECIGKKGKAGISRFSTGFAGPRGRAFPRG